MKKIKKVKTDWSNITIVFEDGTEHKHPLDQWQLAWRYFYEKTYNVYIPIG